MLAAFILFNCLVWWCRCEGPGESRVAPTPDINDLFPSFNEPDSYQDVPSHLYTNISLDIEKLDINKFKKIVQMKMPSSRQDDTGPGDVIFKEPRLTVSNLTDTVLNDTRRFGLIVNFLDQSKYHRKGENHMIHRAYNVMLHTLCCDTMLQLIYMAKTQVSVVEENENVNTGDTGYRIGYVSQKCNKLFKKLSHILGFMRRWQYSVPTCTGHIVLHHRTVRLHIDFLYQFWAVTQVDEIYKKRYGDKYMSQAPVYDNKTDPHYIGISKEDSIETAKIIEKFGHPQGYGGGHQPGLSGRMMNKPPPGYSGPMPK